MAPVRVFLSAVSSEFGKTRTVLASDLRARGMDVKVQEDFAQFAGVETTLALLHGYIEQCDAVIAIMGTRSGTVPPVAAAAPFRAMLPPGIAEASYTQWEIHFARHHRRRLSIHVAGAAWEPEGTDLAAPDRGELQAALRDYLFGQVGANRREGFTTTDRLCREVLREVWPDRRPSRGWFSGPARPPAAADVLTGAGTCEGSTARTPANGVTDLAAGSWTYAETVSFASAAVKESLGRAGNRSLLAIDDGVVLYRASSRFGIRSLELAASGTDEVGSAHLVHPSREELLETIDPAFGDANSFLRARLLAVDPSTFSTNFECKVGVRAMAAPLRQGALVLNVRPLSYWTVREFNRRLLTDPGDRKLQRVRASALQDVLCTSDHIMFTCPSALYLEMAVLTSDDMLVTCEKAAPRSVLAQRGRRWTCTLEEGFSWPQGTSEPQSSVADILGRCLLDELQVEADCIESWKLLAFAIEHTHLNSALLGYCRLKLHSCELASRIEQSDDFGRGYEFVPLGEAVERCFGSGSRRPDAWHPTARLRVFLTLKDLLGHDTPLPDARFIPG